MRLRHTPDIATPSPHPWFNDEPAHSHTDIDPNLIRADYTFGFVAQWHLPDTT